MSKERIRIVRGLHDRTRNSCLLSSLRVVLGVGGGGLNLRGEGRVKHLYEGVEVTQVVNHLKQKTLID